MIGSQMNLTEEQANAIYRYLQAERLVREVESIFNQKFRHLEFADQEFGKLIDSGPLNGSKEDEKNQYAYYRDREFYLPFAQILDEIDFNAPFELYFRHITGNKFYKLPNQELCFENDGKLKLTPAELLGTLLPPDEMEDGTFRTSFQRLEDILQDAMQNAVEPLILSLNKFDSGLRIAIRTGRCEIRKVYSDEGNDSQLYTIKPDTLEMLKDIRDVLPVLKESTHLL